ncbi:MAG: terminase family protein [Candidatus Caldarchaeum sp.]
MNDNFIKNLTPEEINRLMKGDVKDIIEATKFLEKFLEQIENSGTKKFFVPGSPFEITKCPKHAEFFRATKHYRQVVFLAGNRTGKTVSGCFFDAVALTGDYPSWWEGRVFDHPVKVWCVGKTAQTTRDTLQKELLGPPSAIGTGLIPKDRIIKMTARAGVPGAVDQVLIRHKSGGVSILGFKSADQGVESFMGTERDIVHCDEEVPISVYNECFIRTMTTNGIVILTFTPLQGITPLIVHLASNADYLAGATPIAIPLQVLSDSVQSQEDMKKRLEAQMKEGMKPCAIIQAGWDDAPWLDDKTKAIMLESTPPHLRDARSKGIPTVGSGNVYPIPVKEITCKPFRIPDHWKRIFGMDVGYNRTAVVWMAINPDNGQKYVYDEYYSAQQIPEVHFAAIKARGLWIPGVIDPSSQQSQYDGNKLIEIYRRLGLKIYPADNDVEAGIYKIWSDLQTGQIKVFDTLVNFLGEYQVYARDESGRIIKKNDHLMDAWRYANNSIKRAISMPNHIRQGKLKSGMLGGFKYDI